MHLEQRGHHVMLMHNRSNLLSPLTSNNHWGQIPLTLKQHVRMKQKRTNGHKICFSVNCLYILLCFLFENKRLLCIVIVNRITKCINLIYSFQDVFTFIVSILYFQIQWTHRQILVIGRGRIRGLLWSG